MKGSLPTYHRISPFLLLHLSGQRLPQPLPPDVHKHKAAEPTMARLNSQMLLVILVYAIVLFDFKKK